jgi:hypothetical protein
MFEVTKVRAEGAKPFTRRSLGQAADAKPFQQAKPGRLSLLLFVLVLERRGAARRRYSPAAGFLATRTGHR